MKIGYVRVWIVIAMLAATATAQAPGEWRDELVERMAGNWKMAGQVMGREAHHEVRAEWVLNHQFLRVEEKTAAGAPSGEKKYDAVWFLGYDAMSEKYVLHLMDVFGGRFSETLGYGSRDGNQMRFVFEYPDGPFHTTFRRNAEKDSWEWLMEQKDKDGKWGPFANLRLTRMANPQM